MTPISTYGLFEVFNDDLKISVSPTASDNITVSPSELLSATQVAVKAHDRTADLLNERDILALHEMGRTPVSMTSR